jgi:hypothetical protein
VKGIKMSTELADEIFNVIERIKETGFFIGSHYHPIQLYGYCFNDEDVYGAYVSGMNMITHQVSEASIVYDRVTPITEEQAKEAVEEYEQNGNKGLAIKYGGYTPEEYDQFEEEWR